MAATTVTTSDNGIELTISERTSDCSCHRHPDINLKTCDHDGDGELVANAECGRCGDTCTVYYRPSTGWSLDSHEIAVDGDLTARTKSAHPTERMSVSEWE